MKIVNSLSQTWAKPICQTACDGDRKSERKNDCNRARHIARMHAAGQSDEYLPHSLRSAKE